MKKKNNIWYSFTSTESFKGEEPPFFNISNEEWYKLLNEFREKFLDEFKGKEDDLFVAYFNNTFANKKGQWKFIPFKMWGRNYFKNRNTFPELVNVVEKIPFVASYALSKLEPHTNIKSHTGDSNVMYRIHVPLMVPSGLPDCGFRVLREKRSWNEIFAFCDAHDHEAWNNTDQDRIILIIDIIRPEFESKYNWIRAQVLASLWIQFFFQWGNIVDHLPIFVRKTLMNTIAVFTFLTVPLVNFFGKVFISKMRKYD